MTQEWFKEKIKIHSDIENLKDRMYKVVKEELKDTIKQTIDNSDYDLIYKFLNNLKTKEEIIIFFHKLIEDEK